jgi:hypothetical protein
LLLSTALTVILGLVIALLLNIAPQELRTAESTHGPLSDFLLAHIMPALWTSLVISTTAIFASVGLKRRRKLAYWTWIDLLALAILWNVACVTSQIIDFQTNGNTPAVGSSPNLSLVFALSVSFLGVALTALCLWILRVLLSQSTRSLFMRSTPP